MLSVEDENHTKVEIIIALHSVPLSLIKYNVKIFLYKQVLSVDLELNI